MSYLDRMIKDVSENSRLASAMYRRMLIEGNDEKAEIWLAISNLWGLLLNRISHTSIAFDANFEKLESLK